MKYLHLLFLIIIIYSTSTLAQNKSSQKNNIITGNEAIWDLQLFFDLTTSTGSAYGAEFDGNYFYSVWWPYGTIQKYNTAGNFIEQFTVSSFVGIRDLAFDGTYMYGGKLGNKVYKMDFINKTLIDSFDTPVPVQHIAYDAVHDAFWVGNSYSGIYLVDRNGVTLSTIPAITSLDITGSAWDNISVGGPYLWLFDSWEGIIRQMKLPEGILTGIFHSVTADLGGGSGGGLFISTEFVQGTISLGGLLKSFPNKIFVYEIASTAPPCPVGPAENPSPQNNSVNVSISLQQLTWTNPSGSGAATMNEVYFGTNPGNMSLIHSGSLVSSVSISQPLEYNKTYYWKVVEKNDTCSGVSTLWKFSTAISSTLMCDDFSTFNWIPIGPQGLENWSTQSTNHAGGSAPELRFWGNTSFTGESRLLSPITFVPAGMHVDLSFQHYLFQLFDTSSVFTIGYTTDGGNTITTIWSVNPTGSIGPEIVYATYVPPPDLFQLIIRYQGSYFSFNTEWYIDNICNWWDWPVELKSFTVVPRNNHVILSWTTSSETNNLGFEIERSTDGVDFNSVSFVQGSGTTTEEHSYSYTDINLKPVKYFYRLKQVDLDGTFEFSEIIEADLSIPFEFNLGQNYPNPFNPSTTISYSIPRYSKVIVKIFDILGSEITTLVNEEKSTGVYEITWNAGNQPSGVYFYRIEAGDFTDIRKMILMK